MTREKVRAPVYLVEVGNEYRGLQFQIQVGTRYKVRKFKLRLIFLYLIKAYHLGIKPATEAQFLSIHLAIHMTVLSLVNSHFWLFMQRLTNSHLTRLQIANSRNLLICFKSHNVENRMHNTYRDPK